MLTKSSGVLTHLGLHRNGCNGARQVTRSRSTAVWQVLWPPGVHQLTWPHVNFGVLLMLAVSISIQLGNTFAAVLFPTVGPMGTMTLRMVIAALLLAPVARPKIHSHTRSDWISVLELAVCLGGLNICIYYALSHLPIGVAVTVEFLGPLTLAALGSRSWRDGIAILLALTGVDRKSVV